MRRGINRGTRRSPTPARSWDRWSTSPEQVRAVPLNPRTDIYPFGIVLFELFTGRVPFRGDTPMATMLKHLTRACSLSRLPPEALLELRARVTRGHLLERRQERLGRSHLARDERGE
jgi:serine/threonine protein kinase